MLISREEKDGYIVDTYSNGTIVKNIKSEPVEINPDQEPEPSQLDRIEANTQSLMSSNSALDVLLGVSE